MDVSYLHELSDIFTEYHLNEIIDHHVTHCDDIAMTLSFNKIFGNDENDNPFLFGISNFELIQHDKTRNTSLHISDSYEQQQLRTECMHLIEKRLDIKHINHHYQRL